MADTLVMNYLLRQVKNQRSSVYGRWFAYVDKTGNITTRGLAEYLIRLGVTLDRSDLEKIIVKLAQAVPEIVAQGYGLKIPGLGIFYATIMNVKGGAENPGKFSISSNVAGVKFKFRPDSSDLDDLTSKSFGKRCTFGNGVYVTAKGNKAPRYPIAGYEEEEP